MQKGILFFPQGSNRDQSGQAGLHHLLEHFIILACQEIGGEAWSQTMLGATSHIFILFYWEFDRQERPIWESMTGNVLKCFSDKKEADRVFTLALEEVKEEIRAYGKKVLDYEVFLYQLTGWAYRSPLGYLADLEKIKVYELEEAFLSLPRPSSYIFSQDQDDFLEIVRPRDREVGHGLGIKKTRGIVERNKGDRLLACCPIEKSDLEGSLKKGMARILYSQFISRIWRKREGSGQRMIIDWGLAYEIFEIEKKGGPIGGLSSMDVLLFQRMKKDIRERIEEQKETPIGYLDLMDEVVAREIFDEGRIFSSKEIFLEELDQLSYQDFKNFVEDQGIV